MTKAIFGEFRQAASDLGLSPNPGPLEQYIPTTTYRLGMAGSSMPLDLVRQTLCQRIPSESGSKADEEIPVPLTDRSIYSPTIQLQLSNLVKIPISPSVEVQASLYRVRALCVTVECYVHGSKNRRRPRSIRRFKC